MSPESRILLVNDTGNTSNPGCRAVKRALSRLLDGPASRITQTIPLGYGAEPFADLGVPSRQWLVKAPDRFPTWAPSVPAIDWVAWEQARRAAFDEDASLHAALDACDWVVVNGEGTLHHDSRRALALLALMKTAQAAGKPVALVNCTLQALSPALIQDVLASLAVIHVREPRSAAVLAEYRIPCQVTVDLGVLGMPGMDPAPPLPFDPSQAALVTAGVTANPPSLKALFDAVTAQGLRPVYFSIGDGNETAMAEPVCTEAGVPLLRADDLPLTATVPFLSQFPLAISGRHHLNLFLMAAGVPFLALPSNTWKIEETLAMLDYPLAPVGAYADLPDAMASLVHQREVLARRALDGFAQATASAERFRLEAAACAS